MRKIVHVNYIKNNALKPKRKLYDASEKYFYSSAIFLKKLLKFIFLKHHERQMEWGQVRTPDKAKKSFVHICAN